jgi:hypothetical protein
MSVWAFGAIELWPGQEVLDGQAQTLKIGAGAGTAKCLDARMGTWFRLYLFKFWMHPWMQERIHVRFLAGPLRLTGQAKYPGHFIL